MELHDGRVVAPRAGFDLMLHNVLAPSLEEGGQGDLAVIGEETVVDPTLEEY